MPIRPPLTEDSSRKTARLNASEAANSALAKQCSQNPPQLSRQNAEPALSRLCLFFNSTPLDINWYEQGQCPRRVQALLRSLQLLQLPFTH